MSLNIPKPLLKWAGGKTQILDKIISEFPKNMNNYHEIFLGGGSVLLTVLQYKKNGIITIGGNIYASDVNQPLIYVYKNYFTKDKFEILQLHALEDVNRKLFPISYFCVIKKL